MYIYTCIYIYIYIYIYYSITTIMMTLLFYSDGKMPQSVPKIFKFKYVLLNLTGPEFKIKYGFERSHRLYLYLKIMNEISHKIVFKCKYGWVNSHQNLVVFDVL